MWLGGLPNSIKGFNNVCGPRRRGGWLKAEATPVAIKDGMFELQHARLLRLLAGIAPSETLAALQARRPRCLRAHGCRCSLS